MPLHGYPLWDHTGKTIDKFYVAYRYIRLLFIGLASHGSNNSVVSDNITILCSQYLDFKCY